MPSTGRALRRRALSIPWLRLLRWETTAFGVGAVCCYKYANWPGRNSLIEWVWWIWRHGWEIKLMVVECFLGLFLGKPLFATLPEITSVENAHLTCNDGATRYRSNPIFPPRHASAFLCPKTWNICAKIVWNMFKSCIEHGRLAKSGQKRRYSILKIQPIRSEHRPIRTFHETRIRRSRSIRPVASCSSI